MKVAIAYARPDKQLRLDLELPEGTTVGEAIARSGVLRRCPEIDLGAQKVGIYGKLARLDAALADGDRVEIYRPLTCDPKTVARRVKKDGAAADPE